MSAFRSGSWTTRTTAAKKGIEDVTETAEAILNPRTGGLILNVPEASQTQIDRAVGAARRAFAIWSRTTPAERADAGAWAED